MEEKIDETKQLKEEFDYWVKRFNNRIEVFDDEIKCLKKLQQLFELQQDTIMHQHQAINKMLNITDMLNERVENISGYLTKISPKIEKLIEN